jgi:WD40 repeat protein
MRPAQSASCVSALPLPGPLAPPLPRLPSGRYLLATTLDSTARLVDYEAGAALKTYRGHTASSYCIPPAWATTLPSGRPALASGSEDGSVVVWDVDSRQVCAGTQAMHGDGRA